MVQGGYDEPAAGHRWRNGEGEKGRIMSDEQLEITPRLSIPLDELQFQFVRSGGPGGQNVNKVNSKAVLRWSVAASPGLPPAVRARLVKLAGRRIDKQGTLTLASQRYRDQHRNAQDCLDRLRELVATAAVVPKVRRPTRPTRGSVAARLENKRHAARKKESRRTPASERER
jgi:ribosome-associated protein